MIAFEYIKKLPRDFLPRTFRGAASNNEIWRWLEDRAIIINEQTPRPKDEITFPITRLVFFPNGKKRATLWRDI